jgi:hypothetical protein
MKTKKQFLQRWDIFQVLSTFPDSTRIRLRTAARTRQKSRRLSAIVAENGEKRY